MKRSFAELRAVVAQQLDLMRWERRKRSAWHAEPVRQKLPGDLHDAVKIVRHLNGWVKPERMVRVSLDFSDGHYTYTLHSKRRRPSYMTVKEWGEWFKRHTIEVTYAEYRGWMESMKIYMKMQDRLTQLDNEIYARNEK